MYILNMLWLVVLAALWGGSFIFIKMSADTFSPLPLMGVRVMLATCFLAVMFYFFSKKESEYIYSIKEILIIGIINQALPFSLFAFAALTLSAGDTAILNSTTPMWASIIAYLWFGTKLGYSKIIGIILGFGGVVFLMWGKVTTAVSLSEIALAIIAVLLATFLYGVSANYTKAKLTDVPPLTVALGSMISASLVLTPFTIAFWPVGEIGGIQWLSVGLLGIASTGIAYIIFFHLIQTVGPTNTVTVTFLIPVFGLFFGSVFLGEEVTYIKLIACTVIVLGTILATGFVKIPSWPKLFSRGIK